MTLKDFTAGTCMLPRLACDSKDKAIVALVQALASAGVVTDPQALVRDVLARELLGDTALAPGLAIPHVRSPHVAAHRLAIATLRRPVVYLAGSSADVEVLILLVGPEDEPRTLLKMLARVVGLVRDTPLRERLLAAGSAAEMLDVIDV